MSRTRISGVTRGGGPPQIPETRAIDRESRRVIREDLLGSLLVEAGAGSGKTQMLAERMAAGVTAGVYDVEHMAAVTFTRKAASELRGRFQHALEARLSVVTGVAPAFRPAKGPQPAVAPTFRSAGGLQPPAPSPQPDEARARIERALSNIEHLFAGTIHSFCARLLRERPVESGVSPGFTELDEIEDIALRKRAWREFIAQMRLQGDPEMIALLDAGIRPADLDNAFGIVCGNDDVEFPPGDGVCPDPKPARIALEAFWRTLEKELPRQIPSDTTCPIQSAARTFRGQLRVLRRRVDRPNVVAELLGTWDCESKITQYRWSDVPAEKKRLRDLVNPLHARFKTDVVEPYLSQWRQYVYRLSVGLLTRARQHAADERRRRNTLNYGDLLTLTARVLRENAQVRRALQRKYRHLFVDEFQDTDPIQAEILFLLAANEPSVVSAFRRTDEQSCVVPAFRRADVGEGLQPPASSPQPDWRRIALRPGSLFIVGDPKQSIYRFRRADIEIYNIVRTRFEDPSIGHVLPLTMNFRSVPSLCEWANGVFAGRFPSEATRYSPKFAALDPKEEGSEPAKSVRGAGLQPGIQKFGCGAGLQPGQIGVFTLTHTSDEAKEVVREDAARIAAIFASRWTPAVAATRTS
jgi:ATP-dependent helicase/nuclease subunit A